MAITDIKVETPFGTFDVRLRAEVEYGRVKIKCYATLEDRQATYSINGREYDGYMWLEISEGGSVWGSSYSTLTDSARRKLSESLGATGAALLADLDAKRAAIQAWADNEIESLESEARRKIERVNYDAARALEDMK